MSARDEQVNHIAIVGMAARLPGAPDLEALWELLREGREGLRVPSEEELLRAGVPPAGRRPKGFVSAVSDLPGIELFDAGYFGFSPREAEVMDPQLRVFLECAAAALQDAGHVPEAFRGPVGVFAGAGDSGYLHDHVRPHRDLVASVGALQVSIANALDSLASLVSYKLNLTGPSLTVQTACSTSLVAVHLACQSLLSGECDLALAGGVSLKAAPPPGYVHREGGIFSRDGHTRSFDARASGTIMGSGAGLVVLRRLEDALADGDTIHAVILGSAVNNDGSAKGGYTAPSVTGHARVVSEALGMARVSPRSIGYVEAHGTATELGDPIEVEGLTRAFREGTSDRGFCALGSLKTNVGHLDHAAGVAGLIKCVLALRHRQLPASLHFETPNPRIDFAASPFRVNARLVDWPEGPEPRRAGVSSLGIGGTNAHVILQEAPPIAARLPRRGPHLLRLSARSESALEGATDRLARHLRARPDQPLEDVAFTLDVGRPRFADRRVVLGDRHEAIAAALESRDPSRVVSGRGPGDPPPCAFLFPGQGAQYVGMGEPLYRQFPTFREELDRCAERLRPALGLDLRDLLVRGAAGAGGTGDALDETRLAQPALFAVEYALARLWMSLGVSPRAMIGHSVGEYVAATLAGVFRLEDALALVAERGRLMQTQPRGAMLAVPLSAEDVSPLLSPEMVVAASNTPGACVVSGPEGAAEALEADLRGRGLGVVRLRTSHAFHSPMMDGALEPFAHALRGLALGPPRLPFLSNVTGEWITEAEARDAGYWTRHLRAPVQFAAGLRRLLEVTPQVLLEVGPGQALGGLVRQQPLRDAGHTVLASLPRKDDAPGDPTFFWRTAGRLWVAGVPVDERAGERGRRVPLPTYPFERQRYWVDRPSSRPVAVPLAAPGGLERRPNVEDWLYRPAWRATGTPALRGSAAPAKWLVIGRSEGLGTALVARMKAAGHDLVEVPLEGGLDREVVRGLSGRGLGRVLHLGSLDGAEDEQWERGFHSLREWAGPLAAAFPEGLRLRVITRGAVALRDADTVQPARAALVAAATVLRQELPGAGCGVIDVGSVDPGEGPESRLLDQLEAELGGEEVPALTAFRAGLRFTPDVEPVGSHVPGPDALPLPQGAYLITGGLGRVGLSFARALVERGARGLALLGRSGLPPRDEWAAIVGRGEGALRRRIRAVQALEAMGAEVLTLAADVADLPAMRGAVSLTRERLGPLRGVLHAAGVLDASAWRPLRELTPGECARQLRPKVEGLSVLENVLQGEDLDFVLLASSLSSVLGGVGYGAYAAGNAYMDAFVERQHARGRTSWISANWDAIATEGLPMTGPAARELQRLALSPDEVGEALARILALGRTPRVLVSTADLRARLASALVPAGPSPGPRADTPAGSSGPTEEAAPHARPNLLNPYVAPGTETERRLALLWGEQLGIARVGVHDNFFELGGTSLLAVQLMPRVGAAFGVDLSVASVFEGPTVQSLSRIIEERAARGRALEAVGIPAGGSEE